MPLKTITLVIPYYRILNDDSITIAILKASKHLNMFQRLLFVGFAEKFRKRDGAIAIDHTYEMTVQYTLFPKAKSTCILRTLDLTV